MKKRVFAAVVAAAMVVTAFTGCGSTGSSAGSDSKSEAKVEAPTEPFGDTVKYDPSVEINDGKDITVELWECMGGFHLCAISLYAEKMSGGRTGAVTSCSSRSSTDTQRFIQM